MPPANQGSKGALITWTVVATVFGITMAVLALVFYSGQRSAESRANTERARADEVFGDADLGQNPAVESLRAQRDTDNQRNVKLLPYAINQAQRVSNRATGNTSPADALGRIENVLQTANGALPQGQQAADLAGAVNGLLQEMTGLRQQVGSLQEANNQLEQSLENQTKLAEETAAGLREEITQAQEQRQEALALNESIRGGLEGVTTNLDEQVETVISTMTTEVNDLQQLLGTARAEISQLTRQRDQLTGTLQKRVGGEQLLTKPDGEVIVSPADNRLTIDVGRRNGVFRGLTFEVYDSVRGIPPVNGDPAAGNIQLPRGKASIEIIRVSETSSEARVISQQPGQPIREGDVIANLAFDRDIPVRFRIYGQFDLDNSGNPNAEDAERLKTLIGEFGGEVVDDVTVDTDIVVLGKEPVIPEGLDPNNPNDQIILFQARQAIQEYEEVLQRARQLNKSILNQNQLLNYIGYFEQARR